MTGRTTAEQFFEEVYPLVHRYLSTLTGASSAEVDDLVQETLLSAWSARGRVRADARFETWVLSIAGNVARKRWRKAGRTKKALVNRALRQLDSEVIPADLLASTEMGQTVRRALGRLKDEHAEILRMKYIEDRSLADISAELRLSGKAAESRLQRARAALRQILQEDDHVD